MNFIEFADRLIEIDKKIISTTRTDPATSSAFEAVVEDLERKSRKLLDEINQAQRILHEPLAELEQAADSAKAAVDAEKGITAETRRLVLDLHGAISSLKSKVQETNINTLQNLADSLAEVHEKITAANHGIAGDTGASPALRAVMNDLKRRSGQAFEAAIQTGEVASDTIPELDQASESALAAAEAEENLKEDTRRLVRAAHEEISSLRTQLKRAA